MILYQLKFVLLIELNLLTLEWQFTKLKNSSLQRLKYAKVYNINVNILFNRLCISILLKLVMSVQVPFPYTSGKVTVIKTTCTCLKKRSISGISKVI